MTDNLQDALEQQKKQSEPTNPEISGLLGIPLGGQKRIEVSGRNGYVYVRLRSNQSEVIQAYNNKVSASYDLPVNVVREGNRYVIAGVDSKRYDNNWTSQSAYLPRHGNTHSFDVESGGGGDVVWVQPRQIVPLLAFPSGSAGAGNIIINPFTLQNSDGSWKYVGNTGTADIVQYNPTSPTGSIMVLVYLDSVSGNPKLLVNSGTVFSNSITGSSQVVPYIPSLLNPPTQIPLAAVRLITGTSRIVWDNIYDLRQWVHPTPSGSSGGGSPLNTGVLDARYLRLDSSNDPLTNNLEIDKTDGPVLTLWQNASNSGNVAEAAIQIYRNGNGASELFSEYGFSLYDWDPPSKFSGGFLYHHDTNGTVLTAINEYASTNGTVLYFNSENTISSSGKLLLIKNHGVEKFSIDGSGNPNIPTGSSYRIGGLKVVSDRVIDARITGTVNSGDSATDDVIKAMRDAMLAHGLLSAT